MVLLTLLFATVSVTQCVILDTYMQKKQQQQTQRNYSPENNADNVWRSQMHMLNEYTDRYVVQ